MAHVTNLVWDSTNSKWVRLSADVNGKLLLNTNPLTVPQIIPSISGVSTGEIFLDALGAVAIAAVRATINPGDAVVSSNRLATGSPDVLNINDGETLELHSSASITNVTIAMVAEEAVTEAAYNSTTKVATGTLYSSLVVADYETVMVEFDFDSTDAVNMVALSLKTFSDGTTADNLGTLKIAGYSL